MKPKGVLVISFCLNLGLVGALAFLARESSPAPETSATTSLVSTQLVVRHSSSPAMVVTNRAKIQFNWRSVESEDYKEYIGKLRGIECPEETIRDIILADVEKLYAPRFAALRPPEQREFKFWKRNVGYQRPNPELVKQMKVLTEEKDALIKELLGVDSKTIRADYNWWEDRQKEQLSFLSEDKQEQLKQVKSKFDEERQAVYARAQGYFDEEDQADIKKIHKKELAEMAKFMTPDEVFEYEVRTSDASRNLQREVASLSLSEDEFRQIFRLKNSLTDDADTADGVKKDANYYKQQRDAQAATDKQIKELLGDERGADYQRSKDYGYQNLVQAGQFLGFDKAAAAKVVDMQKPAQEAANKVRSDTTLTPEERTAKLQAIRTEAERAIKEAIGEKGYKSYRRQGGYWLSNIYNN